jgi:hypothetical protein
MQKRSRSERKRYRLKTRRAIAAQRHQQTTQSPKHYTRGERKIQKRKPVPRIAPSIMSLINDPEGIIQYMDGARSVVRTLKHPVFFDFAAIQYQSSDAVNYIVSALDAKPLRNSGSRGNMPVDSKSREILIQCRFFDRVHFDGQLPTPTRSILQLHDERLVVSEVARDMRRFATKHTLGQDVKNRALQETAIDCMANSQEHALPNAPRSAKWFFIVYFDVKTKVSHFTFIDRGIGILESIKDRDRGFFSNILFQAKSRKAILEGICKGEIGSRTNEPNRGKGLPKMYRYFTEGRIGRFLIISNDIFADFENNDIRTLNKPFEGTCIHWELRP